MDKQAQLITGASGVVAQGLMGIGASNWNSYSIEGTSSLA